MLLSASDGQATVSHLCLGRAASTGHTSFFPCSFLNGFGLLKQLSACSDKDAMPSAQKRSTSVPPPSLLPPIMHDGAATGTALTPAPPVPVPATATQQVAPGTLDFAFQRDKFLLKQKRVSINEKYTVADEHGREIIYVERPRHTARNIGALLAGVISGLIAASLLSGFAAVTPQGSGLYVFFIMLAILGGLATCCAVAVALSAKRHVGFYSDKSKCLHLLDVIQDKKVQLLTTTYTVRDAAGTTLAHLQKKNLYNLIRRRWYCRRPDGELICVAKEDSILRSILRRSLVLLAIGPLALAIIPLAMVLRTNFVYLDASNRKLGVFNRKLTLFDRYMLDMSADSLGAVDRRVAIALGVMLDTGERR